MGLRMASGAWVLALMAAMACAQSQAGSRAQVMISSGELVPTETLMQGEYAQGELMREIDDPHTGDRWLLVRDDQFPGGPGRMVLVAAQRIGWDGASQRTGKRAGGQASEAQLIPIIRSGDRLTVEEHTARIDAVLEARALNSAAAGAVFNVRLTIGGRVVRAVALGPGRAVFEPGTGVRP
jgi:hypothetical protein